MHTTNYTNTFMQVAIDNKIEAAEIPLSKKDVPTVASLQFDLIKNNPYKYTSDELLFKIFALRNDLAKQELPLAKDLFFSMGQPCMRCSPLTKRYGWGIHYNAEGKMAIFGKETTEYEQFCNEKEFKQLFGMKSKR
jgi:hypothetical protein